MKPAFLLRAGLALGCLALFAWPSGRAQVAVQLPTLVGFKAPIHEHNRLVALVSGREARPSFLAGEVQVTEFKLETYRYQPDRLPALVVESPGGIFGARGARSDQAISVRSADGRFAIQGQGWSWSQASGFLYISNRVRATLQGLTTRPRAGTATNSASGTVAGAVAPTSGVPSTNRPPIEVEAESFSYNLRTGAARFRGRCLAVQEGRVRLWAGELASHLTPDAGPPDAIAATNDVRIELLRAGHEGRAEGSSAEYSVREDVESIAIRGPATWEFGPGRGSADSLLLLPGRDAYSARGHARLRLSRPDGKTVGAEAGADAGGEGAAAQAQARARARAAVPMDIACEAIDAGEGEVVFRGPVTATQAGVMDLSAGGVTATLVAEPGAGQRALSRLVATNQVRSRVRLATNDVHFLGQRLVYAVGGTESIELDGEPSWTALGSTGTATRFVIRPDDESFEAIDDVRVRWSATDPARTNVPPVVVSADRLKVQRDRARLTGRVQARLDAWDLRSGELDLLLATNAAVREIVATRDVEMKYRMPPLRASSDSTLARTFPTLFAADAADVAFWTIRAPRVQAGLTGSSSELSRIEATGGVTIRNVALQGEGGRLVYDAGDGLLRLTDDARLHSPDGVDIVGEPATTLGLNPVSGELVVDGPVKRMVLPAPRVKGGLSLPGVGPGTPPAGGDGTSTKRRERR